MTSKELPEWQTLLEVVNLLDKLHINYMLTGSLAKTFYAVPRMTRDIDLVVELEVPNVAALVAEFEKSFYIEKSAVMRAIQENGMFNILHNAHHIKVDLIVRKPDEYRNVEFNRRRQLDLRGEKYWVVSPEDLVISKLYWAKDSLSEQQLIDINDIMSQSSLDLSYVEEWVKKLSLEKIYGLVKR